MIYKKSTIPLIEVKKFVDELVEFETAVRRSGHKDDAIRINYWRNQILKSALDKVTIDALWSGIRIGAAIERVNAEISWAAPILKQIKAKKSQQYASKKQAENKTKRANDKVIEKWKAFKDDHDGLDPLRVYKKFKKTLSEASKRRFSKLVPKPSSN